MNVCVVVGAVVVSDVVVEGAHVIPHLLLWSTSSGEEQCVLYWCSCIVDLVSSLWTVIALIVSVVNSQ